MQAGLLIDCPHNKDILKNLANQGGLLIGSNHNTRFPNSGVKMEGG
jgi:hypothetical protein